VGLLPWLAPFDATGDFNRHHPTHITSLAVVNSRLALMSTEKYSFWEVLGQQKLVNTKNLVRSSQRTVLRRI
jgi:hypothetical protein